MGIKYLWDTNTCIYFLKKLFPVSGEKFIDNLVKESQPSISVVTETELLCRTSENQQELKHLEEFVSDCYIFELDQEIKKEIINIRRDFKVKLPDAMIAATSRMNKLTLLTRNVKDFERIESLKLINPWEI
jgi:predicted nucleic acid-binding protein